jgi:pimeloyl-ACP methyl ester carboxylesterase
VNAVVNGSVSLVSLHGREVLYLDSGPRGDAYPLVMLHGIGASSAAWGPAIGRLTGYGLRTIAIDLPGHGGSSKDRGDYSLAALASVVRDLLDRLEVDRCILVGHSLGGGIALQFAYQFPERVAGLALVSSGGLGEETSRVLRLTAMPGSGVVMATAFNRRTLGAAEAVARVWRRIRPVPNALTEASLARLREIADPGHRNAFLATLRAVVNSSGQRISALPRLAALADRPTLVVWGSQDHILPMAHGQRAHELLGNNRLEIFAGAGHEPHLEDPDRFADLLFELHTAVEAGPREL